ncbi:MAG: hypothetical protein ACI9G1_005953 [Pirellulaceae bacterium]|jgi:hypothetical protein
MTRTLPILAIALLAATCLQAEEIKAPAESGLKPIFNGKDLSGWSGDTRLWSVKDGVIRGETTKAVPANGNTFLIWEGETKDFELRLSFRCNAANNSGIQYRSKHITEGKTRNKWVVRGYQHEIRNQNILTSVSGFIYEEGGPRGRMAMIGDKTVWNDEGKKSIVGNLIDAAGYEKLFKLDEWNDVIIIAKGSHLQHYMNGRLVMDCVDNHPKVAKKDGVLALQLHAGSPMWVEFKDVRFKEVK